MLTRFFDRASASRSVIGPSNWPSLFCGDQPLARAEGRVVHQRGGHHARLQRGRVQEGLEADPGWRQRLGGVVERLAAEVEAAHQRPHPAAGGSSATRAACGLGPLCRCHGPALPSLPGAACTTRTTEPGRIARSAGARGRGPSAPRRPGPDRHAARRWPAAPAAAFGAGAQHDGHAQVVVVAVVLQRQCGGRASASMPSPGAGSPAPRAAPGLAAVIGQHAALHGRHRRAAGRPRAGGVHPQALRIGLGTEAFHHHAARHLGHVVGVQQLLGGAAQLQHLGPGGGKLFGVMAPGGHACAPAPRAGAGWRARGWWPGWRSAGSAAGRPAWRTRPARAGPAACRSRPAPRPRSRRRAGPGRSGSCRAPGSAAWTGVFDLQRQQHP
jgi:hypothetical protein